MALFRIYGPESNPFVLSLSKHRPFFRRNKKEERPFDKLRANGSIWMRCSVEPKAKTPPTSWVAAFLMVGVARIELATPAMSTQCSTTELHAHPLGRSEETTSELQSLM